MSDRETKWRLDAIERRLDRLDRRQDDILAVLHDLRGFARAHDGRMARLEKHLLVPEREKVEA